MSDGTSARFARTVSDDRTIDFNGEPATTLPGWAENFRTDGLYFELFPPSDFEIAYRIAEYCVFAPYARAVLDVSIDDAPTRRLTLQAGAAFFAPPDTVVRARMTTPVEFLVMTAPPDRAEPIFERTARDRAWAPELMTSFSDPGFTALHLEVRRSLLSDPLIEPTYLAALGDAMLARIGCRLHDILTDGDVRESLSAGVLRRLVRTIESDLAARISVEDLAHSAGLSRSHFSRAFQAATGASPQEFIIGRRLCRARDLLAETNRSIADIAAETGFSSHAHLTTAFKKRIGVTPDRYRRAFLREDI